jgi:hypothetical protein
MMKLPGMGVLSLDYQPKSGRDRTPAASSS